MRFPIKLGKKHFPNEMLKISENWLGCGYWMAKKEFFSNAHLFSLEEEMVKEMFPFIKICRKVTDGGVKGLFPNFSKLKQFTRTEWARFSGKEFDGVLFVGPENEGLLIDKLYVMDMFDLDFVYATGGGSVITVVADGRKEISILIASLRSSGLPSPPSCSFWGRRKKC